MSNSGDYDLYEEEETTEVTRLYPVARTECSLLFGFCQYPTCPVCHGLSQAADVIRSRSS